MKIERQMIAIADGIGREMSQARAHELAVRTAEALLFAAAEPLSVEEIAASLPAGAEIARVLADLSRTYERRGVNLVRVAGKWAFRTAPDLAHLLARGVEEPRKLSRAAMETLAIIAYHQPVTRADIEDIRGVSTSRGTLDLLMEIGWVRLRGRRRSPGRPVTYGTTPGFLAHFGLDQIEDLPGLDELKGAGFLDSRSPAGFSIPTPSDSEALAPDEEPLDDSDLFAPLEPEEGEGEADADAEGPAREPDA